MFAAALCMLLSLASFGLASPVDFHAESHGNAWQYGAGGGVVGFIVLVLDVIIILEVLKSTRPVSHKLLWSLFVFFCPILGAIIYFLFSNREAHKTGSGYEAIP